MEILLNIVEGIGIISAICFTLGLVLVTIEMFIPGFGIPGVTGTILLFLGIILTADTWLEGFILLLMILIILGITLTLILHFANKGKVILTTEMKKEQGYIGAEDLDYFLHKEGIAINNLRPAGTVDFDGVKLDVVSDGQFIKKGKKVKVIEVEGRRIVVSEIKDEDNK